MNLVAVWRAEPVLEPEDRGIYASRINHESKHMKNIKWLGCTYCGDASLWALLAWATCLVECYLIANSVAPADLIFTRTVFLKFSMLYCYLILCLNMVLLVWKK